VSRSGKIDHQVGDHDDFANAAAGAVWLVSARAQLRVSDRMLQWARSPAGTPPPALPANVFSTRAISTRDSVSMSDTFDGMSAAERRSLTR
jgi:hypothetical protein